MRDEVMGEQHTLERGRWRAWDEFVESQTNTGFRQSSWYTAVKVASGWNHFGAVLRDGEAIVGGATVLTRTFTRGKMYYYIPDGPVLPNGGSDSEKGEIFRRIMEYLEGKRRSEQQVVSHLCINPRWERVPGFAREFQESSHYYGSPRDTQCIELNSSEDAILAQMKPKGRYNIRVAERHGVSVVEDVSPQGIEDFISIYRDTFTRKSRRGQSASYFHTLIPMLSAQRRGSLYFAEYQGMRLAAALMVFFGRTATYYYGGSRALHRNVMAPYLLQFEIMRIAKNLGCRCYDLFGVTPHNEPNDGWTDISAFKRKFGGRELRLVPSLEYIYDPVAYQEWRVCEEE